MNAMYFLVNTVFDLYLLIVLLRLWLQWARADFYNPFSQFIVKVVVAIVKVYILIAMGMMQASVIGVFIFSIGIVIKEIFKMIFWVLILQAILSWVSQGRSPIEYVMRQLTEPLLAPIRRFIPPMGGLDFSVLVALIALQFLQMLVSDIFVHILG